MYVYKTANKFRKKFNGKNITKALYLPSCFLIPLIHRRRESRNSRGSMSISAICQTLTATTPSVSKLHNAIMKVLRNHLILTYYVLLKVNTLNFAVLICAAKHQMQAFSCVSKEFFLQSEINSSLVRQNFLLIVIYTLSNKCTQ